MHNRKQRLMRIRTLLTTESISSQELLAKRLKEDGFDAVQSAISRDLRELGVGKVNGFYVIPDSKSEPLIGQLTGLELLQRTVSAGPNLLVLHTATGGASRVALGLDQGHFSEVLGTIAGDDTIFVATLNEQEQMKLQKKLTNWQQEIDHD